MREIYPKYIMYLLGMALCNPVQYHFLKCVCCIVCVVWYMWCMHLLVWIWAHVHRFTQHSTSSCFLNYLPPAPAQQSLSLNLNLPVSATLASQWAPEILSLWLSLLHHHPQWLVMWMRLGIPRHRPSIPISNPQNPREKLHMSRQC